MRRFRFVALGATVAALGCGGTEGERDAGGGDVCCEGELGGEFVRLRCGESACLGGDGFRCTSPGNAEAFPEACGGGDCSPLSCSGCCDGEACLTGDSSSACGIDGDVCMDCGPRHVCDGGRCIVDPESRWTIRVLDGEIPERACDGDFWDLTGNPPDAYVEVEVGGDSGMTDTDDDTDSPSWNQTVLSGVLASDIQAEVGFFMLDADTGSGDDFIQGCGLRDTPDGDFGAGPLDLDCGRACNGDGNRGGHAGATLRYEITP